jgi:hypothetical protein
MTYRHPNLYESGARKCVEGHMQAGLPQRAMLHARCRIRQQIPAICSILAGIQSCCSHALHPRESRRFEGLFDRGEQPLKFEWFGQHVDSVLRKQHRRAGLQ